MSRTKLIVVCACLLGFLLAILFVSQVSNLRRQLRTSVRIIPSESKSREEPIASGADDGALSSRTHLLVKFRAGVAEARINEITNDFNDRVQDGIEAVPGLMLINDPDDEHPNASAARYSALPEVEYAEPNYEVTLNNAPDAKALGVNDPRFNEQRWLTDYGITEVWKTTRGSDQMVVAVLDTGVEYTHNDLKKNMWTRPSSLGPYQDRELGTIDDVHGYNALLGNGEPVDDNGHGTGCAGIIGAECGNSLGICGANWHIKILPLKFINAGGFGNVSGAIQAINYVINRKSAGVNIRVVNVSWGMSQPSRALEDAIRKAQDADILFVAAGGSSVPRYPADYKLENILSVADRGGTSASLVAPGKQILSTTLGNEFAIRSGSSMSASVVAGLAALTLATNPNLSPSQLRSTLLGSPGKAPVPN